MGIDEAIEILNGLKEITQTFKVNCNLQDYKTPDAIETLINEYNNLKQIEEAHRIENGKLREELKQEKEKNKELKEELQKYISGQYFTEKQVKHLEMTRKMFWINKDEIRAKIKELEEKSDYWNCDEIEVLKELLEE